MPINNITQTISTIPPAGARGVDVQSIFVAKQEDFQDHLQGTTVTELNTFKDQLNLRIGEINSTATTMDGYTNTASASASTATTKAGEASASASEALTSRNQAETFKNNASASATKANQWADNNYNVEVEIGRYSAKHWATVAENTTDRIGLIDYAYVAKAYHIVAFGGEFNRVDYPKLWAYLQANPTLVKTQAQWTTESTTNGGICGFFSDGNGTTTFRVPNLDKAFLRPDSRGVGSFQIDAFKAHQHSWGNNIFSAYTPGTGAPGFGNPIDAIGGTSLTGGAETRPKNIAVLPLIVAK